MIVHNLSIWDIVEKVVLGLKSFLVCTNKQKEYAWMTNQAAIKDKAKLQMDLEQLVKEQDRLIEKGSNQEIDEKIASREKEVSSMMQDMEEIMLKLKIISIKESVFDSLAEIKSILEFWSKGNNIFSLSYFALTEGMIDIENEENESPEKHTNKNIDNHNKLCELFKSNTEVIIHSLKKIIIDGSKRIYEESKSSGITLVREEIESLHKLISLIEPLV
eukprot:CAMPEP_0170518564 /NCGR_PEP_ID=MMETSP0209-20121228/4230_1 /TAXON_ID=665100 ORGANISM="Litonotus pictus, Strain P1" /NCGR_SAMPLE_ID=MMETSP0209 /ASSEMBLY_ACC=CAM_ASM_000301 /LENGTH=217 /DNA_ID=CAMNT_0010804179 /DNA_START=886 /DNA_END=1535 /DNA_ORIENTATION=+